MSTTRLNDTPPTTPPGQAWSARLGPGRQVVETYGRMPGGEVRAQLRQGRRIDLAVDAQPRHSPVGEDVQPDPAHRGLLRDREVMARVRPQRGPRDEGHVLVSRDARPPRRVAHE